MGSAETDAPPVDDPDTDEDEGTEADDEETDENNADAEAFQGAAPQTDLEAERLAKDFDRIEKYLRTNYRQIYGDEATDSLIPCPLCTYTHTYGFVVPVEPPFEVQEAVKQVLAWRSLLDYETDESVYRKCQTCNGKGQIRTLSEVPTEQLKQCRRCAGKGYVELTQQPPALVPVPQPAAPAIDNGAPAEMPPYDQWGTPSWHGDYGKSLEYRTEPVEQWKANLPH